MDRRKQITLRIDEELFRKVREISKDSCISFNHLILNECKKLVNQYQFLFPREALQNPLCV